HGHAPGISANLDRAHDPELVDVDHRDVAGGAVGGKQQLLVGGKGQLPDTLADQEVLFDFEGGRIDDRDAVGRAQRHERQLGVAADAHADWLDGVSIDAGNLKGNLGQDLACVGIDHGDLAADLGADPNLRSVRRELRHPRPAVDQHVVDDVVAGGIDE